MRGISKHFYELTHSSFSDLVLVETSLLLSSKKLSRQKKFDDFPADKLKLWKVEIRAEHDDQLRNLSPRLRHIKSLSMSSTSSLVRNKRHTNGRRISNMQLSKASKILYAYRSPALENDGVIYLV
ncbi:hypothetical protein RCL_jg23150.t1 [Rhizophagus clarus]|uniref:Uncharacterized protein n=1 Tax=Rhizophagus clarus TaxID=94130 RepID=A0A8H3L2C8_9GLOM|nr:hypothetical protein RCL_jg23150.t1 [Rhizophagus clarus]